MKKLFISSFLLAIICSFGLFFTPELANAATDGAVAEITYKGHKYAIFEDATSWTDAKEKCKKLGGHLATITTAGENEALFNLYKQSGFGRAFFGLYNAGTPEKPDWKWITGEKLTYQNWGDGQPDYYNNEEAYGGFYRSCDDEQGWNDFEEDDCPVYICEWEAYTLKIAETKINLDINDSTYIDYVIDGKTSKKITFKSSNTKVVKVSSKGKLVAKQAGSAKITVKLGYEEKVITVTVNPEKVTKLKTVSNTKKSIKLFWKKQAGIAKYQVYMYDTDLEEYVKVKTVDGDFNVATISGLDKNTTYKFKVRAYVKSGSKNVYGEYSKVLKAKTKK